MSGRLAAASERDDFLELTPALRYAAAADANDPHAIAMLLKQLHMYLRKAEWQTYAEVADIASRGGSGWCACQLASRYEAGIYGFPKDPVTAYAYWVMATKFKYPEDEEPVLREFGAFTHAGELANDPELKERFYEEGVRAGELASPRELSNRMTQAGHDSAKLDAQIDQLEEQYREREIALRKAESAANNELGDAIRNERELHYARMQAFGNALQQLSATALARDPWVPPTAAMRSARSDTGSTSGAFRSAPLGGPMPIFARDVVPNPTDWPNQRDYYLAAARAFRDAASRESDATKQQTLNALAAAEEQKAAALRTR